MYELQIYSMNYAKMWYKLFVKKPYTKTELPESPLINNTMLYNV